MNIRKELIGMSEEKYGDFTAKLIPTLKRETILGIRIPVLRKFSRGLLDTEEGTRFLETLPHYYLEENNLHAIMLSSMKDPETVLNLMDRFLPFVDNWETSDIMEPKCLRRSLDLTREYAHGWLHEKGVYQRRYAIVTFMNLFLTPDSFDEDGMKEISEIGDDDYYVKMAAAWYWAEAMVRNPEKALPYFEKKSLDTWIQRKAIQKARESYRVPEELKKGLSVMK